MPLLPGIGALALAVAIGGLAAFFRDRTRGAMPAVRTFAVVAAASIALIHLLPEAVAEAGWLAVLAAAAGFLVPAVLERAVTGRGAHPHDGHGHRAPTTVLAMGYAAVIAHQLGEGAALASLATAGALSAAIVLAVAAHTVPLAMVVAIRVIEVRGGRERGVRRATALALAGIAAATAAGALGGNLVDSARLSAIEPWLLAAVAGVLLHALAHDAHEQEGLGAASQEGRRNVWSGAVNVAAALAAIALALLGIEAEAWAERGAAWMRILGFVAVAAYGLRKSVRRRPA